MNLHPSAFTPVEMPGYEKRVVTQPNVIFGRTAERDLALDVYRPITRRRSPLPLVLFIHGGGWHGGNKESYADLATRVAAQGYVTAALDYRLSGEAPFPAAVQDCKTAVRWLAAHAEDLSACANRVAVWGHSAGAHLAALVALTPGRFEPASPRALEATRVHAALCFSGPFDFPALGDALRGSVDAFVGAATREEASPITYASPDSPPHFICHGQLDDLVPFEQASRFVAALRKAGAPVEFVPVPEAGHDLERHSPVIVARALAFLARHLC